MHSFYIYPEMDISNHAYAYTARHHLLVLTVQSWPYLLVVPRGFEFALNEILNIPTHNAVALWKWMYHAHCGKEQLPAGERQNELSIERSLAKGPFYTENVFDQNPNISLRFCQAK